MSMWSAITVNLTKKCLFEISSGLVGLGPPRMRAADVVCVPNHCYYPIIHRKVGSKYVFVGGSYVYGWRSCKHDEGWAGNVEEVNGMRLKDWLSPVGAGFVICIATRGSDDIYGLLAADIKPVFVLQILERKIEL